MLTYGSLTPEVPLGPFAVSPIRVWSAPGKAAKLHAAERCSRIRAGRVTSSELPLGAVVKRMCPQCARYGQWARPGTGVGLFLGALTGLGLLHELGSYGGADEDTFTDDEVKQAAVLLLQAPQDDGEDSDADEEEEDDWRARREAQEVRDSVVGQWRSAAASQHRSHRLLALFPWLKPWADAGMRLKADHVALLQQQAGQLLSRGALAAAAGVTAMGTPDLPAEDPVFALLGAPTAVAAQLTSLWRRWSRQAADSWEHPREHDHLAYELVRGISSRRKGREAALERAQGLVAAWTLALRAGAAGEQDERMLLVRLPEQGLDDPLGREETFLGRLSEWELGVLACWATDADWEGLIVTLRVPEPVAARLLSQPSALSCLTPEQAVAAQDAAPRAPVEAVGPGVFDDTPVSERRAVTAGDLRALRTISREVDQLYLVLSVEAGPEVLPLSVLEERVARGGRYVVVAAAGDLPDALVAARREELTADAVADEDPVWMPHIHQSSHPDFGRSLGTAEGERLVVRLARGHSRPDAALRCLLLARGVADLRDLGDRHDASGERRDPVPFPVWDGLLAMEQLDLRPFRPVRENGARRGGSGLPLGVLASVQLYTTDAAGQFEGRAHSPGCQHQGRDRGLSRYYDLVTVQQMLDAERFAPCSKCGGYATRRLSTTQVAYYRAAHQVHDLAQQVQWVLGHPDLGTDTASLLAKLKEWDAAASPADWFDTADEERQWSRFIRHLVQQLQAAVADPRPSS
ncbi:hypothetical protein [Streptomyces sp. MB09-02B]|uniref:hypothetical protein n=1 Tax=Streptomyces sp. MB09-02B TaxID=3028667 RepID=UPI0029A835C8|nr:hypothetical protein [Streptomyces sp. MB09-02B]MDX3639165.1 hypothetical protein [Streptomyces sp. MB09-02B]